MKKLSGLNLQSITIDLVQIFHNLNQEEVGAAETVDAMTEEPAVREVEEKVADNINLMKWQRTVILTSWQKQRFMILMCTSYSRKTRRGK